MRPGFLYISKIEGHPAHKKLNIEGGEIVLGQKPTIYTCGSKGSLGIPEIQKYLGFSGTGKLVLYDQPYSGFLLTTEPGYRFTRRVSFDGLDDGNLCTDGLIMCGVNVCAEGLRIQITYEDRVYPRKW